MDRKLSQSEAVNQKMDANEKPLVSIITPVLNGAKHLETCIKSVLEQIYPCIEHIFVDGGSTDGTLEMLLSYHAKYPDRVWFISKPGTGAGDAWNEGLRVAKGQIFGWLGADDMSEPGAIQLVVDFFKGNPDAYFVFGNCNFINAKGEIFGKSQTHDFDLKEIISDRNVIPCTSAFYKREVIEQVGVFEKVIGSDRDYWIRVGQVFPIHRIETVLSSFRMHEGSATTGVDIKVRKKHMRQDCLTTRRYGGSIFAGYCRRYYWFVITEGLRPILGFAYPFLKKVTGK
jgi:glycosyltransferase involved in cell wall biosynthesis